MQDKFQKELAVEAQTKLKEWLQSQDELHATEAPSPGVISLKSMISEKIKAKVRTSMIRKQSIILQKKKLEVQPVYKDELVLTNKRLEEERQQRLSAI
mmetsp:Transcript_40280/g.61474  ORF Transcript_40280/g.61474 Transcript_40280/m.61474 type:complete len:98 (-) Transcript_40280:373-666(-)